MKLGVFRLIMKDRLRDFGMRSCGIEIRSVLGVFCIRKSQLRILGLNWHLRLILIDVRSIKKGEMLRKRKGKTE